MTLTCRCGEKSPDADNESLYALGWRYRVIHKTQVFYCPDCTAERSAMHIRLIERTFGKDAAERAKRVEL